MSLYNFVHMFPWRRIEHLRAQPPKEQVQGLPAEDALVLASRTEELWHCAGATWCGSVTAGDYYGVVVGGREEDRRRRTDSRAVTVCVCIEGGREGGRVTRLSMLLL